MKVLIVCDVLGEENNGTTIAAMNLIRYLINANEEVRILCPDQDKKNLPNYYVVPHINLTKPLNKILKKNNVCLAKPVEKIIKQALDGVDIVHVLIPFALGCKTAKVAKKMGIPVTASFHCQAENFTSHIFHTMNSKWINHLVYKNFYKKLYKHVNAIHYPTEFIKNLFENEIKHLTNAYVISNGVNDRYIKKEIIRPDYLKDKFNILFIGRLSKEKSHPILLRAIAKSKYKNQIRLIFAGQGPKKDQILSLSDKLNISRPIIKFFSRDELVNVINSCDLYVHPAEIEIEAISCLEAISCGLVPVIANSPRSATKSFALDEHNLFHCNDPLDLAKKIDYWIEHPSERKECSNKYLGYTKKFNQSNCLKQMHNMLKTYAKVENHTKNKVIYYRDELNDDFAKNYIKPKMMKSEYKYIHHNPIYKILEFVLYFIFAKPAAFILNKIVYKQKIINHLTVSKRKLKGCFIYSNHILDMGDAYTPNLIFKRRNNIIVGPEAVSIRGCRTIVKMLGAIPLPSTTKGVHKYLACIEHVIGKGQSVTIYPEAHIWPYYTKIRNFKSGSFRYPIRLNRPVICLTNTVIPYKNKHRLVTHIDGPFYPNDAAGRKLTNDELKERIITTMKKRSIEMSQYEKYKYINLNEIEAI